MNKTNQKFHPRYRDLKFKKENEFWRWLSATAKYCVHFKDNGQDCLKWWIDEGGEVLHADLQSSVWNGMCVDLANLKVGKYISVVGKEASHEKSTTYDFVVAKIEKVTNRKEK